MFNRAFTKKPRKHEEDDLQRTVAAHLRVRTRILWFHVPNGGARDEVTAAILKAFGVLAGVSDILTFPRGIIHALELKSTGKKPRKSQLEFKEKVLECGGQYEYADNLDDALRILERWRVIRSDGFIQDVLPPRKYIVP